MSGTDDLNGPRAVAVRAIRAGHDLHHRPAADPDLALLDGDRLYAEGLSALADAGDLEAIRVMAEVIAGSAAALARGDDGAAERSWEQGLRALGARGKSSEIADR